MNNAQSANIIKNLCRIRGYPVSKMLTDCCIRKSLMYDMEKRDWTPSATVFEQIADYLDCSVDYLLGRTDVVEVARSEEYVILPVAARSKKGSSESAEPHKLTKQQWEEAQEALSDLPDRKELPKFNLDED